MPETTLSSDRQVHPLKRARLAAGLSQKALADLVGVSQMAVSRWEGGRTMRDAHLQRLANVLQVPVEQLLADGTAA